MANAKLVEANADEMPFADEEFDGAALCGVLGSLNWETLHRAMLELRRLLCPGARIAAHELNEREHCHAPSCQYTCVYGRDGRLMLSVAEPTTLPQISGHRRYVVDPESPSARKLRDGLSSDAPAKSDVSPEELRSEDILDAWYEEHVLFDPDLLERLARCYGFRDIQVTRGNLVY